MMAETNAGDESETALGGCSGLPKQDEEYCSLSTHPELLDSEVNNTDKSIEEEDLHCPKCDFKTRISDHLKLHILSHLMVAKNLACLMMNLQSNLMRSEEDSIASKAMNHIKTDDADNHGSSTPYSCLSIPSSSIISSQPCEPDFKSPQLISKLPQMPSELPQMSSQLPPMPSQSLQMPSQLPQMPSQSPQMPSQSPQMLLQSSSTFSESNGEPSPSSAPIFTCPQCLHSCTNVIEFKLHTLLHCAMNNQATTARQNSSADQHNKEQEMTWPNISNHNLCCPICRCYSLDENSFNVHLKTHIHHGRFWCDKCLFSSSRIEEMKIHLSSHCTRSHKRISCPHCDFTTANKSYFKVHLSTHTGEGKMYCNYCNYSTVYKSNFKQHVAAHEKKSELQCPMCDFKCVGKSEYGLHFASHTGEKRLSCPFCKFNTSNKTYFKQHVGSHTGAGKMHCPFCKFSTVNKSYYRIHLSKHTGEGTLRCSLCSFTTVYKNNFRRHLAKHQTEAEESSISMNILPPRRGRPSKSWKEMQALMNGSSLIGLGCIKDPMNLFRPQSNATVGGPSTEPVKLELMENNVIFNGTTDPNALSHFFFNACNAPDASVNQAVGGCGAENSLQSSCYDVSFKQETLNDLPVDE
ncbi:RE1-silencing transcription factor-like isoform X2 [Hyalella azteca]|uniref:RE1-silencing transcription factor-like isoform X2 n=1 Tax=Hyalella azteca TaxID=294128 RepID=A0A8B7P6I8_HYAAZ|nr:RE1-silencing transcription factor-like isoform X2 [Hyalella azteca]